jgi:hypothetical protein
MPQASWVLCDTAANVYLDEFSVGATDVPGSEQPWRVSKRTLRGGTQEGVDLVEVDNGHLRFIVIPTRGMSIWRAWGRELELGWRSPVRGPVHPQYVTHQAADGLGWLEGFDELLVRCGLQSNGAPEFDDSGKLRFPLHGRIGNLPAQRVEIRFDSVTQEISVIGVVEETRFHFYHLRLTTATTTRLGQPGLTIHDEVLNCSALPAKTQLLYHLNIGEPFLGAGAKLVAPVKTVAPMNDHSAKNIERWADYQAGVAGADEDVYLFELQTDAVGQSRVLLKNPTNNLGLGLSFDGQQMPCFTQWKHLSASPDGYVTGLEPGTNYPYAYSHELQNGRVVQLQANQTAEYDLRIDLLEGVDVVTEAERGIVDLASSGSR